MFNSIEICAGTGGQALGLEQAGFNHLVLIEIDQNACETLRLNRPLWNIKQMDIAEFSGLDYRGIDLLAGGIPCPPFSIAGKMLGKDDDRNLFPEVLRLTRECLPKALMIENVSGLMKPIFKDYRNFITKELEALNYKVDWRLFNAKDFGVPQSRQRTVLIAMEQKYWRYFAWPEGNNVEPPTVGQALYKEMAARGWKGAHAWSVKADAIAPTIVGGSKKHGGPDLGPTRSKKAWAALGVNGHSIAEYPPDIDFEGMPRLTIKMASILQGFPKDWVITGKKTAAYRQVGNAFPPPVAKAVGESVANAIEAVCSVERGIA